MDILNRIMNFRNKLKYLLILLSLAWSFVVCAHPHSFVDVQATIKTDTSGIKQIEFLWVQIDPFGEDMSSGSREQYLKWCRMWLNEHIVNDNYCCSVFVNNRQIKANKFTLNKIELLPQQNQIQFSITLDVSIPVSPEPTTVDILMEDKDYYVAFCWLDKKTSFSGNEDLIRNVKAINDDQTLHFIVAPATCEINEALPDSPTSARKNRKWLPNSFLKEQFYWNRKIHKYLQALKIEFSWSIFLLLFGGASVYGIFHAAGPGHGKGLIAAYFLSGKHSAIEIIKTATLITLMHTGTALFLVLLFYFSLSIIPPYLRIKVQSFLNFTLALAIITLGGSMFVKNIKGETASHGISNNGNTLLLLAGMLPCPLSIVIMLGCIATGIWQVGLFLIFGISLGTFAVLVTVASLCHYSSNSVPAFLKLRGINQKVLHSFLNWLKYTLIIFSGCILAVLNWPDI